MKKARHPNGARLRWLEEQRNHTGTECLEWPFSCATPGYGQLLIGKKMCAAHRVMCEMVHGAPPESHYHAAHSCGNRKCVNPDHLSWKTPSANQLDRPLQGRPWTGRKPHFTPEQVRTIRALKGKEPLAAIAAKFGCTVSNILHIQNRATYRYVA